MTRSRPVRSRPLSRFRSPAGQLPRALKSPTAQLPVPPPFLTATLVAVLLAASGCGAVADRVQLPTAGPEETLTRWGGDLMAVGRSPAVAEEVQGDIYMAGASLHFLGTTTGDLLAAGGGHRIQGRIDGNLRAAGSEVHVHSHVGGNGTFAGGRIQLHRESTVTGNTYMMGGLLIADGVVDGHLRAIGDEILLDGLVEGSVNADGRTLVVGPNARIGGDLHHRISEGGLRIDPSAEIVGEVQALTPRAAPIPTWGAFRWGARGGWVGAFLLTGLIFALVFPGTSHSSARGLDRRPLASGGLGILWLILFPVAIAVAAITVVGVPLAVILAFVFATSLYLARLIPALWLGRRILGNKAGSGRWATAGAFLLGGVFVAGAELIPLVGPAVFVAATLFGLGAFVLGARTTPRGAAEAAEEGPVRGRAARPAPGARRAAEPAPAATAGPSPTTRPGPVTPPASAGAASASATGQRPTAGTPKPSPGPDPSRETGDPSRKASQSSHEASTPSHEASGSSRGASDPSQQVSGSPRQGSGRPGELPSGARPSEPSSADAPPSETFPSEAPFSGQSPSEGPASGEPPSGEPGQADDPARREREIDPGLPFSDEAAGREEGGAAEEHEDADRDWERDAEREDTDDPDDDDSPPSSSRWRPRRRV